MTGADRARFAALLVFIALHVGGAALLGHRAPRGFEVFTLHFYAGQLLPLVVCACGASVLFTRNVGAVAFGLCGLWLGASSTALALVPRSTWRLVVIGVAVSGLLALLARRSTARFRAVAMVFGLLAGAGLVVAQRAPVASTHPLGGALGPKEAGREVSVRCGGQLLSVAPVLTFESCADDRFWALWAESRCSGADEFAVQLRNEGAVTVIEAQTRLSAPVFSHLNDFATVSLERGGLRASLAGGDAMPFSRPSAAARFAWLSSDGALTTALASEHEKGPFTELGTATLRPSDALVVVLSDDEGAFCRVHFDTWAQQASLAPSPTAGWGVAQNALELLEAEDGSASALSLSLAATSIGRGWDTVGHAEGTYRNVIRLESLR